ncbi:MAG: hypothetical protein MUE44_05275 [Oscillatoriaceae cyanobacterium Prado104]|jgi:hypothetical protein|nr:hypothetical protein [Oscillatoriaceae cyanobacterium Prado104]
MIFIGIAFLGLLLALGLAISAINLCLKRDEPSSRSGFRRLIATLLILALSYGLLKFYVPRRIAFFLSRPAFEKWLATHPVATNKLQSIDTKLGIYQVDEYFAGNRGDRYFRVYSHGDGLGPDRVSYGFAYQPNSEGSPFGNANYKIYRLGDGWYWFQVSDDW